MIPKTWCSVVGTGGDDSCLLRRILRAWSVRRRRRSMTPGVMRVCSSFSGSLTGSESSTSGDAAGGAGLSGLVDLLGTLRPKRHGSGGDQEQRAHRHDISGDRGLRSLERLQPSRPEPTPSLLVAPTARLQPSRHGLGEQSTFGERGAPKTYFSRTFCPRRGISYEHVFERIQVAFHSVTLLSSCLPRLWRNW